MLWLKNYKKENENLKAKNECLNLKIDTMKKHNNKEITSKILEINELNKKLANTEERRRINAGKIGGLTISNKRLKEQNKDLKISLKEITKAKLKSDEDFKKYFELYNIQTERNKNLTEDIHVKNQELELKISKIKELNKKLELKENPVTIKELKEYELFRKPRRKKDI